MPNHHDSSLSSRFEEAGAEEWREVAETTLRGTTLDKLLTRVADRDRRLGEPARKLLYTDADSVADSQRSRILHRRAGRAQAAAGSWDLRQPVTLAPRSARAELERIHEGVLQDLAGGASSLEIDLRRLVDSPSIEELHAVMSRILEGVHLDYIALAVDGASHGSAGARALLQLAEHSSAGATVALNLDPVAGLARRGASAEQVRAELEECRDLAAQQLLAPAQGVRIETVFRADGAVWSDAGCSNVQELAAVLATTAEYLRSLPLDEVPLKTALESVSWRFAVTTRFFSQTAKLRAARVLFGRMAEASEVDASPLLLEAMTARRVLTTRDSKVNLLRSTATTFAAVVGGADVVTAAAYDAMTANAADEERSRARRLARNTQVILMEESSLGMVSDPAGGSWAIESQTADLARAAWQLFQEIERRGGIIEALISGWWPEQIAQVADQRHAEINKRQRAITGVSAFPDIDETTPEPVSEPAGRDARGLEIRPLPLRRNAQAFEQLSAEADRAAREGRRPSVFLANLGTQAEFNARAAFAENLLASAGIAAIASGAAVLEAGDLGALAADFSRWSQKSSGTAVILCSTDQRYGELAAEAAKSLAQAGADFVVVAGRPPDNRHELEAAGVDSYIYLGMDTLEFLSDLLQRVEASQGGMA